MSQRIHLHKSKSHFSSGDSKNLNQTNREENNNDIDVLTKDLEGMGCVVDMVKRPPNVCMEACVHENTIVEEAAITEEEDAYSDEFEAASDVEESISTEIKSIKSETTKERYKELDLKLTKSQSSMSMRRLQGSNSSMSGYGSLNIPQTRRINMSFTNDRLREIERHNHILLNKILSVRNSKKSSIPAQSSAVIRQVPPAAVQRKKQQRRIDHDNMILLKKIQRAKSSSYSLRR